MKLICEKCNYQFESKILPERCPYCGREGVEEEPDAQELINES